jgi:dTDP-4-dehydrorhamnose reductase
MAEIVVTGATGQLGRAFRRLVPHALFLDRGDLDLSWPPDRISQVLLKLRPRFVLNCAAYTAVDQAETEPDVANRINGWAVQEMASTCARLGARLVTYSSDYVFNGEEVADGYREEMATDPISTYGKSKVIAELAVRRTPNAIAIRTSWVFGDGKNFFNTMLEMTGEQGMTRVPVVADQVGRPTYAADLATATLRLLELERVPSILHVSNDGPPVSWCELANATFRLVGSEAIAEPISTQQFLRNRRGKANAVRPHYSVLNLALLSSLGVTMRPWEDALADFLRELQNGPRLVSRTPVAPEQDT